MHPPRPPRAAQELSWRARLTSLRNVRPLLQMVWETSPPLVVTTGCLRLARALLPAAMLWVSKLILDAVVGRISRGTGSLTAIWNLVALELGLATMRRALVGSGLNLISAFCRPYPRAHSGADFPQVFHRPHSRPHPGAGRWRHPRTGYPRTTGSLGGQ